MKTPIHVALVIFSMKAGGAERVTSYLANFLTRQDIRVSLITFEHGTSFFPLADAVEVMQLDLAKSSGSFLHAIKNNIRRMMLLRQTLKKIQAQVVISFMDTTNVLTILACIGLNVPVIISERSNPHIQRPKIPWQQLKNITYPFASALVTQTNAVRSYFPKRLGEKIYVIANPVLPLKLNHPGEWPLLQSPYILSIGRLSQEKGFNYLIEAMSKISLHYPDWHLYIIGDGQLKTELINLRNSFGLQNKVTLLGEIANVAPYIKQADIFAFTSLYEGFPNTLCEAMAMGKAVVSSNCNFGPSELIKHAHNGILVEPGNSEALAEAIEKLILSPNRRTMLGSNAKKISQDFSYNDVMSQWLKLIIDLYQQKT